MLIDVMFDVNNLKKDMETYSLKESVIELARHDLNKAVKKLRKDLGYPIMICKKYLAFEINK